MRAWYDIVDLRPGPWGSSWRLEGGLSCAQAGVHEIEIQVAGLDTSDGMDVILPCSAGLTGVVAAMWFASTWSIRSWVVPLAYTFG